MRKITFTVSGLCFIALAVVAYKYLALTLFQIGLSDFYDVAPQVPEICNAVVSDAAVSFSGIFDYVALATALILFALGALQLLVAFNTKYGRTTETD